MAKRKGMLSFFLTESGRKLVFAGACCTTITLIAGNFVPHTFLLEKYREFVQCYSSGIERPVPAEILERLNTAYDKLNLYEYERKLIKPFTVYGFDLFQAGSLNYRFGCILGIPVNFSYKSVQDINKSEIRFRNEPIDWNSENGKLLEEALILSEDEQIFGLCKSVLQLQTQQVLLNSLYPAVSFMCVYSLGNNMNLRLNLYARPLSLRIIMYSILGLFGLGAWAFAKDFTQVKYDTDVDKKLCELGPEFIDAGIRFYDKILKKNIAIRNLSGGNSYTVKGNENYLIRQKSLPLTLRKSYFEMRMKEIADKLQQTANPTSNVTS